MTRILWLTLGTGAISLAVLGIFLPLLPTTPFLLVAAFAFARSSQQLHSWLLNHPRLGPPILDWNREGAISPRAKAAAVLAIAATFAVSLVLDVGPVVLGIQALVLSAVSAFILSRPSPSPRDRPRRQGPGKHG